MNKAIAIMLIAALIAGPALADYTDAQGRRHVIAYAPKPVKPAHDHRARNIAIGVVAAGTVGWIIGHDNREKRVRYVAMKACGKK